MEAESGSQIGFGAGLGLEATFCAVMPKFRITKFRSLHVGRPKMIGPSASTHERYMAHRGLDKLPSVHMCHGDEQCDHQMQI